MRSPKRFVAIAIAGSVLLGCAAMPAPTTSSTQLPPTLTSPPAVENPALRQELLAMMQADQAARPLDVEGESSNPTAVAHMVEIDTANQGRLKQIVQEYGWPTGRLVGKDGVFAAFLIVQHADLAWQQQILPLVRESVAAGDLPGESLALLTDRVLVGEGKPQRYGTQFQIVHGAIVFEPIEDEAHVDARRSELGMPPLTEYKRLSEQLYGLTPTTK